MGKFYHHREMRKVSATQSFTMLSLFNLGNCDAYLCVSMAKPRWHKSQIFGQILFKMFLWNYFLDEINTEISRLRLKHTPLHNVGGSYPVNWRPYGKKIDLSPGGRKPAKRWPLDCCQHQVGWVSRLPAYPANFELASLHNGMSQFLQINLDRQTDTYYWFYISREPWLI